MDARAVDTRRGVPGPIAERIDRALRARFRDNKLKRAIIRYLVAKTRDPAAWALIDEAACQIDHLLEEARRIAKRYEVRENVAYVEAKPHGGFDKTELLLLGQKLARVAVVRDAGTLAIAADFESGLDFVKLFDMGGGMPTRVSIPDKRLDEAMEKLRAAVGNG